MSCIRIDIDEDEMKRLYVDEQWPAIRVAEKLGVHVNIIYNRLRALSLTRKPGESLYLSTALNPGEIYNGRKILKRVSVSTGKHRRLYLVQCLQCGAKSTIRSECIVKFGCPSCSSEHRNLDYPAMPFHFRPLLDTTKCNWVKCPNPTLIPDFDKYSKNCGHVDHNRRCPYTHDRRKACKHCIRGYVHRNCNLEIAKWDWALYNGLGPIPDDVVAYLSIGI